MSCIKSDKTFVRKYRRDMSISEIIDGYFTFEVDSDNVIYMYFSINDLEGVNESQKFPLIGGTYGRVSGDPAASFTNPVYLAANTETGHTLDTHVDVYFGPRFDGQLPCSVTDQLFPFVYISHKVYDLNSTSNFAQGATLDSLLAPPDLLKIPFEDGTQYFFFATDDATKIKSHVNKFPHTYLETPHTTDEKIHQTAKRYYFNIHTFIMFIFIAVLLMMVGLFIYLYIKYHNVDFGMSKPQFNGKQHFKAPLIKTV